MARRIRAWKDVRPVHFQVNYEADPEVATFIYQFDNASLSRLIKNLVRQHVTTISHPAGNLEYCRNTRTEATLRNLAEGGRTDARPAAQISGAPSAITVAAGVETSALSAQPIERLGDEPNAVALASVATSAKEHVPPDGGGLRAQQQAKVPLDSYTGPNKSLIRHFIEG